MPVGDEHDPRDVGTAIWLLELGLSSRKIEAHLGGRIDHTTICRLRKMRQGVAQQSVLQNSHLVQAHDLSREINHYNPCLASSFNHGLGSVTPPGIIDKAVRESNQIKDFIEFRKAKFQLLAFLDEKNLDPIANRFRETLKRRVESLGFDVNSDNDVQFGQLNDMANVGLAVIKLVGEKAPKLNLSKLVDAAILYRRPDWRRKLENTTREFRCPRCQKPRSFVESKDGNDVTCLSCGLATSKQSAQFKIRAHKIDLEYVDLVHSVATCRRSELKQV